MTPRLFALPLLFLLGCPLDAGKSGDDPEESDEPNDTSGAAWTGAVARQPVSGEAHAVWVAASPGSAMAVGPGGTVEEVALLGVDLDASVLVWVTDVPDPCGPLAAWQSSVNDAVFALMSGDGEGWLDALDAASAALPAAFTSVSVGLAAEEADGLDGDGWPITADASTADGGRAGVVLAERQVERPDWEAVRSGAEDVSAYIPYSEVRGGAAAITRDGDALDLALDVQFTDGGTLTAEVRATHCPALEDALAELYGEPSAI